MGARDEARELLGAARRAVEAADAFSELHLALAVAEVLPESDPARRASVGGARSRILRAAALRDDPVAYCTGVLLHRRLLELTGGVPDDLHA
jgi:hypothetical protein